eukprot:COSAG03_NODE_1778_length_3534_cov_4.843086_3_plen_107_part_00
MSKALCYDDVIKEGEILFYPHKWWPPHALANRARARARARTHTKHGSKLQSVVACHSNLSFSWLCAALLRALFFRWHATVNLSPEVIGAVGRHINVRWPPNASCRL